MLSHTPAADKLSAHGPSPASSPSDEKHSSFNFGGFLSPMMAAVIAQRASSASTTVATTSPRGTGATASAAGALLDPALDDLSLDSPTGRAGPKLSLSPHKGASQSATGSSSPTHTAAKKVASAPKAVNNRSPSVQANSEASPDISALFDYLRRSRGHLESVQSSQLVRLMQEVPTMQIMVLGIAQHGAKSRVETQIRLGLRLMDSQGDPVTYWPHLRLPDMAAVKDRGRNRQGHPVDLPPAPPAHQVLTLETVVICASAPTKKVEVCMGCIRREYKRAQRRKENRHRAQISATATPAQSRPGSPTHHDPSTMHQSMEMDWDEARIRMERQRIVIFNCYNLLDFNKGEVHVPARITCYCRHHAEKVGFCVYLSVKDHLGNVVATGISPPIMITDDHKSTKFKSDRKRPKAEYDVEGRMPHNKHHADSPIGHDASKSARRSAISSPVSLQPTNSVPDVPTTVTKSTTPYTSVATTPLNNTTPLPSPLLAAQISPPATPHFPPNLFSLASSAPSFLPSAMMPPPDRLVAPAFPPLPLSPIAISPFVSSGQDAFLGTNQVPAPDLTSSIEPSSLLTQMLATGRYSSSGTVTPATGGVTRSLGFGGGDGSDGGILTPMNRELCTPASQPRIDRLIPPTGPVCGGIEVTLLGTGFHENLTVMFGNSPAKTTHFWSSTTMVCTLPPSTMIGPVVVAFKEPNALSATADMTDGGGAVPFFTYVDDSERRLMELAFQVVGMKMGKPSSPATRTGYSPQRTIPNGTVHPAGAMDHKGLSSEGLIEAAMKHFGSNPHNVQLLQALLAAYRLQNLDGFESALLGIMATLPQNSHDELLSLPHEQTCQTMLHYAAMLGLTQLTRFLVSHRAKLDEQDGNGMTALHFASWIGHVEVVRMLLDAGASHSLLAVGARRPIDLASAEDLDDVVLILEQREGYMDFLCADGGTDGDDMISHTSGRDTDDHTLDSMASSFTSTTLSISSSLASSITKHSLESSPLFNFASSALEKMRLDLPLRRIASTPLQPRGSGGNHNNPLVGSVPVTLIGTLDAGLDDTLDSGLSSPTDSMMLDATDAQDPFLSSRSPAMM
ncbi:SPT3 Dosage dependent suppressor of Ty-induced promoter mutations-like protein [Dimargaris xerosporica]|nr:SPT3 Dosage dependent suppressor of Ty-induced promoter mutations-like protein [Dimargaris xerosporica]